MLDNRTVILATMCVGLVLTVAMGGIAGAERRYRGPGWWFVANLCGTVGLALTATQGYLSLLLSVILANLAVLAAYLLLASGVFVFLERPVPRRTFAGLMAGVAVLFVYFTYQTPSINARIFVLSLAMVWPLTMTAVALLRSSALVTINIRRWTATIMVLFAMFHIIRGITSLAAPAVPNLITPSPLVASLFFLTMIVWLALSLCLVLMLSLRLERELKDRIRDLDQEVKLRQALEERLAREATLDPLTGLANRRKLEELAVKSLAVARRHGRPLSLVMIDIDHFKQINDRLGHQAGDAALKALTGICQACLREEDTLGRFGGDEFVALLPYTSLDQALATAERLRESVEAFGRAEGCLLPGLAISLGVSVFHPGDAGLENLLARADAALYKAKTSGRNRVCQAQVGEGGDLVILCQERQSNSPA